MKDFNWLTLPSGVEYTFTSLNVDVIDQINNNKTDLILGVLCSTHQLRVKTSGICVIYYQLSPIAALTRQRNTWSILQPPPLYCFWCDQRCPIGSKTFIQQTFNVPVYMPDDVVLINSKSLPRNHILLTGYEIREYIKGIDPIAVPDIEDITIDFRNRLLFLEIL